MVNLSAISVALKYRLSFVKSLYLNFKVLPLSKAIRLPIFVSGYTKIRGNLNKGSIRINGNISPGMILLGFGGSKDLYDYNSRKNYLEISGRGYLVFEGKARFSPHFSILIVDSAMEIGNGFTCNNSCSFSCVSGIKIGEDCLFGGNVIIRDSDGHSVFSIADNGERILKESVSPVCIGNHVWICNKCDILKGVSIASNNIVKVSALPLIISLHMEVCVPERLQRRIV